MTFGQTFLLSLVSGLVIGIILSVRKIIKERKASKNEEIIYYSEDE